MKSTDTNKAALLFNGKPMIQYAVELFQKTVDQTVVVTGFAAETVENAIPQEFRKKVIFVDQKEQLGTGHAVQVTLEELKRRSMEFELVLVGYGDHMMFYTPEVVGDFVSLHEEKNAAITLLTTHYDKPDKLAWGRIVRNGDGNVKKIVEQKVATPEELTITEINPGFYCFDYTFLQEHIDKLEKSPMSGEYYLTDMVELAVTQGHTVALLAVPFDVVGVGVNTPIELQDSQSLHERLAGGTIAE